MSEQKQSERAERHESYAAIAAQSSRKDLSKNSKRTLQEILNEPRAAAIYFTSVLGGLPLLGGLAWYLLDAPAMPVLIIVAAFCLILAALPGFLPKPKKGRG